MDCIPITQKQTGISFLAGRGKISLAVMGLAKVSERLMTSALVCTQLADGRQEGSRATHKSFSTDDLI